MGIIKTSEAKARIAILQAVKKPSTKETSELNDLLSLVAEREKMVAGNVAAIKDSGTRTKIDRDKVKGDKQTIAEEAADRGISEKYIYAKSDFVADSEPQEFGIVAVGDGPNGKWGLSVLSHEGSEYSVLLNGEYSVGQTVKGRSTWVNVKADQPIAVTTHHAKSDSRWAEFHYAPFILGFTTGEVKAFTGKVIEP